MVMDDHAVAEPGRSACKDAGRIIVTLLVMLVLIWIVHTGHELATKTRIYDGVHGGSEDSYIALVFGVATVGFGMLYFIIALIILAELALDLLGWLRPQYMGTTNSEEKEETTICQVCIQGSAIIVSMFMLTWAIYHGCKLASEAPKGGVYPCLVFVVGFTTMAFGFINFIIGISIVAESALYLSGRLQQAVLGTNIHEDGKSDTLLDV